MVSSNGTISTLAGTGNSGYSGDGGPAISAQLSGPQDVTADANGTLYVADNNNNAVRLLTPVGTQPVLTVSSTHGGGFTAGQSGTYTVTVANAASSGSTSGSITVTAILPPSLSLVSMAGTGWNCAGATCVRSDSLAGGSVAPPITLVVNVSASAASQVTNLVTVSGGGAATTGAEDLTIVLGSVTPPAATATVVNAATFLGGPVAPGEIVTVYGTGIGPAALVSASLDASGPPVATTLAGVQIAFDGAAAPLLYVSATQSSAIVPFAVAGKTSTTVQVTYQGKSAGNATLSVAPASPGLFTMASSGSGQGAILNQDWSVNSTGSPAARGDVLMLFGTGGGITAPPSSDGQFSTGTPANLASPVTVTFGGASGDVLYAGAAPGMVAGVFQINVRVPANAPVGDNVPIVVKSGTSASPTTVTVALR
jgi:uncharacterized protein (TIGR03437 family)